MPDGQGQQNLSVDDLAGRIKKKYPTLAKFDNSKLVDRMIQRNPKLQTFLSTDALKGMHSELPKEEPYLGFSPGHLYDTGAGLVKGTGQFLQTIFDPRIPVTGKNGMLDRLLAGNKEEFAKAQAAKQQGHTAEQWGHELAGDIPIFGPIGSEFGERLGRKDIGGSVLEAITYALLGKKAKEMEAPNVKGVVDGATHVAKNPGLLNPLKRAAYEDTYIHAKGLDVQGDIGKAVDNAKTEIGKHAKAVSDVIDTRNPQGVIDASAEAQHIASEFGKLVKTPVGANSWLQNLLKHAPDVPQSGLWSFEAARQFRSAIYDALHKSQGYGTSVLASAYKSMTEKLGKAASDYGMEDSWKHYNTLQAKLTHNFGDIIDSVEKSTSGQDVAKSLGKDSGATAELLKNLKKYGLNSEDISRFVKDSKKILGTRSYRSLFKYIYSTPTGFAGYVGSRAAGLPWLPSAAVGMGLGMATNYLVSLSRAMRIRPEILEEVLNKRELPGPKDVNIPPPTPTSPTRTITPSPGSGPAGPEEGPISPGRLSAPPQQLTGFEPRKVEEPVTPKSSKALPPKQPEVKKGVGPSDISSLHKVTQELVNNPEPKGGWTPKRIKDARGLSIEDATQVFKELREFKKNKYGTGRLAEQAKAVERVTRVRETARRSRIKETQEILGAQSKGGAEKTTEPYQMPIEIPELEEALKEHAPESLKMLEGLRKKKNLSTEEYIRGLQFLLHEALDKKGE